MCCERMSYTKRPQYSYMRISWLISVTYLQNYFHSLNSNFLVVFIAVFVLKKATR